MTFKILCIYGSGPSFIKGRKSKRRGILRCRRNLREFYVCFSKRRILGFGVNLRPILRVPLSTHRNTCSEIKWCDFNFSRDKRVFCYNQDSVEQYPFLSIFNDYNRISKLLLTVIALSKSAPSPYWLRCSSTHVST